MIKTTKIMKVYLSVLLPMDEDLDLFFGHLLPQSDQQVPQFHSRDSTVPLLIIKSNNSKINKECLYRLETNSEQKIFRIIELKKLYYASWELTFAVVWHLT